MCGVSFKMLSVDFIRLGQARPHTFQVKYLVIVEGAVLEFGYPNYSENAFAAGALPRIPLRAYF